MSQKERDRLAVLSQVKSGGLSLLEGSERMGVSYRQAKRLWRGFRELGDRGLVHGLRGRSSNNAVAADGRRERALALYGERYRGFGPTLAAEQMAEREGLVVDHETLRGWLVGAGLWKARRQPRRSFRARERRPAFGELVQMDGSDHAWFGKDAGRCTLMVMIDDATGLVHAGFFAEETTVAAMTLFEEWVKAHGRPQSLYTDRHSIYRRNDPEADEQAHRTGVRPPTRLGEALAGLEVELIWAHSPQAKGRVERMNKTLQDRLVKLLALEGIRDMAWANRYLQETFLPAHNARFNVEAARKKDAHRKSPGSEVLSAALCPVRESRVVDKTGCVNWRGRCFELTGADASPRRRREVVVRQRLDGRVELVGAGNGRVLASRERPPRATAAAEGKVPLVERIARQVGPSKPAKGHPWRQSFAAADSAPARCAHLRCAGRRKRPKRPFLPS